MKRPLTILAALLLLTASLSSCTVTFSGGAGTTAAQTTAAQTTVEATETEPTAEQTETPSAQTESPAPASATDDEYSKNY